MVCSCVTSLTLEKLQFYVHLCTWKDNQILLFVVVSTVLLSRQWLYLRKDSILFMCLL